MSLRTHRAVLIVLAGSLVLASLAFLTVDPRLARATCAAGSSVVITNPSLNSTTTAQPMSGVVKLVAQSTPMVASGLTFMTLGSSPKSIGEAVQSGSKWELLWDSRNLANGSYQLVAVAHYGTATSLDCASSAVLLAVNNTATHSPSLSATIGPSAWEGTAGSTKPFTLDAVYTDKYGRVSHVTPGNITWRSAAGAISPPSGTTTLFKAGTAVGAGTLVVEVGFSGLNAMATAQIKVIRATATNPGSATPGSTPKPTVSPQPVAQAGQSGGSQPATPAHLSPSEATRLSNMPTIFRPKDPTNAIPVVSLPTLSCLEKVVGAVRFAEISGGTSQPTAAERQLAASCFSGSNPIPAVLAPVPPVRLAEVAVTSSIVGLSDIKRQTITNAEGKQLETFVITGVGAPNSNVFIYVFSDPLVLRAETDAGGKWRYVLDNPLEAGQHEVYAVAETDSQTFVRTSAVPIQSAAASGTSPNDAIVVDTGWGPAQTLFVAGAAALVLLAIALLISMLRHRRSALVVPREFHVATASPAGGITPQIIVPNEAASPLVPLNGSFHDETKP